MVDCTNRFEQHPKTHVLVEKDRFMNYIVHFNTFHISLFVADSFIHTFHSIFVELEESWFRSTSEGRPVLAFFAGSPNSCARRGVGNVE